MSTRPPGWRIRVEHSTTFDYDGLARASYNEVRQVPVSTPRQTALEWRITTLPSAVQDTYRDYWGTRVVAFNVDAPHQRLSIQSQSLVDTHPVGDMGTATWKEIAAAADRHVELLESSRYTRSTPELEAAAADLRQNDPAGTAQAVADWVHKSLEYLPGVTHVHTPAAEAFEAGRGVCQDFAHLALCVLRAAGVPCRYVSGYLHPDTDAEVGALATGESHAWVEVWTGGWWGLDPTAGSAIGLRHVIVARGRDYADVAPIRGIYAGGSHHKTTVAVTVTRTA